jgi:hypothetical protein
MPTLQTSEPSQGVASSSEFDTKIERGSAIAQTAAAAPAQIGLATSLGGHEHSEGDDRRALLRALYADRGELIDQEAMGRLAEPDRIRLRDINVEIDRWERQTSAPADDVWRELEELARETMGIQASIEAKSRRPA